MAARLVLVTDGGNGQGRSALAAVRALAAGGWKPVVTVSGRWSLAAASRFAAGTVPVPDASDPAAYAAAVRAEVGSGRYDTVVAASDAAVRALALPAARLLDKAVLAREADRAAVPFVPGDVFGSWGEVRDAADRLPYPIVVKPIRSTAPARPYGSAEDVRSATPWAAAVLVQPFIDGPMAAVCGLRHDGRLVAAVHQRYLRTWPFPCGTACAAETVAHDPAVEEQLASLLEGYDGIFQAQFVGGRLVDLNLRVYGSLPLAVAAGVNLASLSCDLATGTEPAPTVQRARVGVRYRWTEGDLRHLAAGLRQGRVRPLDAVRALRPSPGTAHSVTAATDPLPGLARAGFALVGRR